MDWKLMDWKLMDSAPKDGTVILGFHILHRVPIAIYYVRNKTWIERTLTTQWPDAAFSHWDKLPNKPD